MSEHELELPAGYRERLPRAWRPWLDQLPAQVAWYLERWELRIVGELPLSYSYVVPVERADGRACVLKIQPTDMPEVEGAERELLGLRLAGPVCVEVVADDAANGVLLLARAIPGTNLDDMADRDDDAATSTLAGVISDYGRPLEDPQSLGLRPFEELGSAMERCDARADLDTVLPEIRSARHTAGSLMAELLAGDAEPYLLHGDLHHGNVLLDEARGWLVIDAWGLYGDRAVEVAPALHNPPAVLARTADLDALIRRRLSIYAEVLDLDKDRLSAWCFVYNVIGALWTLEDRGRLAADDPGARTVAALRKLI